MEHTQRVGIINQNTDIKIRAADVYRDWPQIWSIWRRVISLGETHPYPVDATESDARALWLTPRGSIIYVAEQDDKLVSAMMTKPIRYGNGDHVANFDLIVDPNLWRQGIGLALASHVIEATRKAGYLAMEAYNVVETNERAVQLWQRLGFHIFATVPDAFRHPRFGLVSVHMMRMSLHP